VTMNSEHVYQCHLFFEFFTITFPNMISSLIAQNPNEWVYLVENSRYKPQ